MRVRNKAMPMRPYRPRFDFQARIADRPNPPLSRIRASLHERSRRASSRLPLALDLPVNCRYGKEAVPKTFGVVIDSHAQVRGQGAALEANRAAIVEARNKCRGAGPVEKLLAATCNVIHSTHPPQSVDSPGPYR